MDFKDSVKVAKKNNKKCKSFLTVSGEKNVPK